jgi:hypothetical protein
MIPITTHKGIITRPVFNKKEDSEQFPNIKCSKCGNAILNYPFYKNGYEKYYHINCSLQCGQLTIEEVEIAIKRIAILIETKRQLEDTLVEFVSGDKLKIVKF